MVVRRLGWALGVAGISFSWVSPVVAQQGAAPSAAQQGQSPGATAAFPLPPSTTPSPAAPSNPSQPSNVQPTAPLAPPGTAPPNAPAIAPAPPPPAGPPPSSGYYAAPPGYYAPPPATGQQTGPSNEPLVSDEARPNARPPRSVSLTFSPVHLIFPILEVTAEGRLANHVGLAVVGGIGSVTPKGSSTSYGAKELGMQLLFYPLEAFDSLVLGGELMYVRVSLSDTNQSVSGLGSGTAIGPLVGYKLITKGGFTFFAHVGAQYVSAHADAQSTTSGESASADGSQWVALLNLNLGWSF